MGRSTGIADAEHPSDKTASEGMARLEDDPRWLVARRVASSRGFVRSRFLVSFILYICEKHLLDQNDQLTEQKIGEQVFRRPSGYNPGDDNIVRNYARILRQRLDEYFAGEGLDETIRVAVPRGGYIPLFIEDGIRVGENASAAESDETPQVAAAAERDRPAETAPQADPVIVTVVRSSRFLQALCVFLFVSLVALTVRDFRPGRKLSPSNRFWNSFFSPTHETLLVPADSGLVIYENLTKRSIPLADYAAGEYQKHTVSPFGIDPAIVNELGGRRYTSVVDLHLVSAISQLPVVAKSRFRIRYAREITLDDLKQGNVILLGSVDSNPWAELFQKELNFQFVSTRGTDDVGIRNLHPLPGEQPFYETDETDPARTTFGVIAVTPNLEGTGHVLLIEGINMAGTEAAADFLMSDTAQPLLKRVFDSKGDLQPFEVLLKTSNIGANAPRPQIVSERIGTPR